MGWSAEGNRIWFIFLKENINDVTCKAEIDTDIKNKCMDTKEDVGGWDELGDWD